MLPSARIPTVVQGDEILLVLAHEHCTEASSSLKVRLVVLAFNAESRRHMNQVARRSKLAGHLPGDKAIVKVQGYQAAPLSLGG